MGRVTDGARRVLVVDDCPVSRVVARQELQGLGFATDEATDGGEALEALGRRGYDAVLMDCRMPGLDGYETTRRLRQREAGTGRRTAVIGVTGGAGPEESELCRQAGMDALLSKPLLSCIELAATLARAGKASFHGPE